MEEQTTWKGHSLTLLVFAGIVALLNQRAGSAQGNINPILYSLASTAPQAFHDITTGGNQGTRMARHHFDEL